MMESRASQISNAVERGIEANKGLGKRIYIGSLDDSVSRYKWVNHDPSLPFLNKLLIESALFGPPCCARIGNILYHEPYFDGLMRPDISPLRAFLQAGFFQVQMRKETINETIQSRLDENTNSTNSFIEKYNWKKNSDLVKALNTVDAELTLEKGKTVYSGNFRPFFAKLSSVIHADIHPSARDAILPVFDRWAENKFTRDQEMTRSNFERCAIELHQEGKIPDVNIPMRLINAVNHFAYGLGMSDSSSTAEILIETAPLESLVQLCSQNRFIDPDALKATAYERDKLLRKIEDLVRVPEVLFNDAKIWEQLAGLVDSQNDSKEAEIFRNRKQALLLEIDSFILSPAVFNMPKLIQVCREYTDALSSGLKLSKSRYEEARIRARFYISDLKAKGASGFVKSGISLFGGGIVGDIAGTALNIGLEVANAPIKKALRSLPRSWNNFSVKSAEERRMKLTKTDVEPFGASVASKTIDPVKMAVLRTEIRA